jgi:hypothetical protein
MKRYPLPLSVALPEAMHLIETVGRVIHTDRLDSLRCPENQHERVIDNVSADGLKLDVEKCAAGKIQRFPVTGVAHPLPREERRTLSPPGESGIR